NIALSGRKLGFADGIGLQLSFLNAQRRSMTFAGLSVICGIILGGALMLWMYRSHRNLSALGVPGLCHAAAGAVFCWLVPVANLVMPCLVMREIWRASNHSPSRGDATAWQRGSGCVLVPCWWAAWIATLMIGSIAAVVASGIRQGAQSKTDL